MSTQPHGVDGRFLPPERCVNGHEFSVENTSYRRRNGKTYRACMACNRADMTTKNQQPWIIASKQRYEEGRKMRRRLARAQSQSSTK